MAAANMAAAAIWIISNGHISATAHTIHLYSAHRAVIFAIAQLSCQNNLGALKVIATQLKLSRDVFVEYGTELRRHSQCILANSLFVNFYRAMLRNGRYSYGKSSVRLSVRL